MFFDYKGTNYNPQHAIKVGKVAEMMHGSGTFRVEFVQIGKVDFQYRTLAEARDAHDLFIRSMS